MNRFRPLEGALLGALLAAVLGACGGSSASAANATATTHVDLPRSYRFDPSAISIKAGQTVTWTNDDNFTHSVRLIDQNDKVVGIMHPGDHVSYTFTAPGTYHYDCSFHPHDMQGVVVVH
jgi:plastocyanin